MSSAPPVICITFVSKFIYPHIADNIFDVVWESTRACFLWSVTSKDLEIEIELPPPERRIRWFFGGVAASLATIITHPLDLIKVNIQTHHKNMSIYKFSSMLMKRRGVRGFYQGISAAILRQMTYSLSRFGFYEVGKEYFKPEGVLQRYILASVSGAVGGLVGTPADIVNIRMQNDVKLPAIKRRNYKNVVDGLRRIYKEEGLKALFTGATSASTKGDLLTVGQIALYEQLKFNIVDIHRFKDEFLTHFVISFIVGIVATTLIQPVDFVKTTLMNAKPGQFKGIIDIVKRTYRRGPSAFFKGYVPAFIRLAPQIIITLILIEQLRINFGIIPENQLSKKYESNQPM